MGFNLPTDLQNVEPARSDDIGGVANAIQLKAVHRHRMASRHPRRRHRPVAPRFTIISRVLHRPMPTMQSHLNFPAVPGSSFVIINDSGNIVSLFPKVGDTLNDAVHDAVNTFADNTCSKYYCPVVGLWFGGAVTLET